MFLRRFPAREHEFMFVRPVLDASIADIACNKGGESGAGAVATAAAGSQVTFQWTNVRTC